MSRQLFTKPSWVVAMLLAWVYSPVFCADVTTADTPNPTAPAVVPAGGAGRGYHFTVKQHQFYTYNLKQTTTFKSAGDELMYTTTLAWKFALTPVAVSEEQAQIAITIIKVQATHDGPGSRHQVDSSLPIEQDGHEDALLGHLIAFTGAELMVTLNPKTGSVSAVTGGDVIIARINKMAPAIFPGDPPPLDNAAKAAFSSDALTRIWQQLLSLPTNEPVSVPLGPPLQGSLERRWQDSKWTDALPKGIDRLQATLLQDPTPVAVTLTNVAGTGVRTIKDGIPGAGNGTLSFDLVFGALTQAVTQRHVVSWELTPLILR
jgi:hypothetical protein